MTFSGQAGNVNSRAGNEVAGFFTVASPAVHNTKTLTASMTATATTPTIAHTYVFTIVSITFYRAVSRSKNFLSVFRSQ